MRLPVSWVLLPPRGGGNETQLWDNAHVDGGGGGGGVEMAVGCDALGDIECRFAHLPSSVGVLTA
jgi:hypothetical protein